MLNGMDVANWPIEDLLLVPSENYEDEDGELMHCVFSRRLNAVTFVGSNESAALQERGANVLDVLPSD